MLVNPLIGLQPLISKAERRVASAGLTLTQIKCTLCVTISCLISCAV